jgi:hypothetical protein
MLVLLVPIAIVVCLLGLRSRFSPASPEPSVGTGDFREIHVEVLNGCGTDGIARRVGTHLRSQGFDVMTLGNADHFTYPESMVIDRVGKPAYARQVAEALGVPNVIQQIVPDPFRIEEVTVIIGRDYRSLPSLGRR